MVTYFRKGGSHFPTRFALSQALLLLLLNSWSLADSVTLTHNLTFDAQNHYYGDPYWYVPVPVSADVWGEVSLVLPANFSSLEIALYMTVNPAIEGFDSHSWYFYQADVGQTPVGSPVTFTLDQQTLEASALVYLPSEDAVIPGHAAVNWAYFLSFNDGSAQEWDNLTSYVVHYDIRALVPVPSGLVLVGLGLSSLAALRARPKRT